MVAKRVDFRCALIGGRFGRGEILGSLTISGVSYVTGLASIFGFL